MYRTYIHIQVHPPIADSAAQKAPTCTLPSVNMLTSTLH